MRYTIVITKELKDTCNGIAKEQFDKLGGENTFAIGLSSTGSGNPTHYWASFPVNRKQASQLNLVAEQLGDGVTIHIDKAPSEVLELENLKVINE